MISKFLLCLAVIFLVTAFQIENVGNIPKNSYPARVGLVQRLNDYYPPEKLAASMGVPGYSEEKIYNYIILGFWKCADIPSEAVLAWSKPIDYFGDDSVFGKTKAQIQANLRQKYQDGKSHIMVSAFGNRQMPTSQGLSALECSSKLASFVLDNNLDGCDINWQDETTLSSGAGLLWLQIFHKHLRQLLPNHIITHSPMASYFRSEEYQMNSYTELHLHINKTVNFYNVKFFNLGTAKYNNYEQLFQKSQDSMKNTSVMQLVSRGVDLNKIVIAKPVIPGDSTGSGYTDPTILGQAIEQAYQSLKWYAGFAYWQYSSDVRGKSMNTTSYKLKQLCTANKDCH